MALFPTALLALGLVLGGPASAQYSGGAQPGRQDDQDNSSGGNNAAPDNSGSDTSGGSMSLEDARMNFGTVVDAFVAERTINGFWPLKEKSTGNVLHLKLVSKNTKSIRDAGGSRFYSGRVALRDIVTGDTVNVEFVVDFAGAEWKVKSMQILGKVSAKKKPSAKTQAAPPADGTDS
jgi:hypothetical protein